MEGAENRVFQRRHSWHLLRAEVWRVQQDLWVRQVAYACRGLSCGEPSQSFCAVGWTESWRALSGGMPDIYDGWVRQG